jgi:histidine triad (HIT) family protein
MQIENIDTTFLRIINGELPCHKIYEDEYTFVFLSNKPDTIGHTLVIPKKYSRNIYDTDTETLAHIMNTVSLIANHLRNVLKCDGMNVYQNNEVAGFQAVFHIHFHLIPRYTGDGLRSFPTNPNLISELDSTWNLLKM